MYRLLTLVIVAGCAAPEHRCGPPPTVPGRSVFFENDTATMSRNDYLAMVAALDTFDHWAHCAEHAK